MRTEYKIGIAIIVLVVLGLGWLYFLSPENGVTNTAKKIIEDMAKSNAAKKEPGEPYKEIANPSGFVNTGLNPDGTGKSITIGELVGKKVVLVDFLTYSCINCQRTFPYLNAWYEKYKDQGLEIVGIHTPEFAFEKNIENVREAMKEFGIKHPIVLDNNYSTWNAYGNKYWPRKYIIDIHGNVVYDHIGEGGYEETEMKIKELLAERAEVLGTEMGIDEELVSEGLTPAQNFAKSPEVYFGSGRNEYLANGQAGDSGRRDFVLPADFLPNSLYLGGEWNISPEYAESVSDSRIVFYYYAKNVYFVAEAGSSVSLEVWQDGKLVNAVEVKESRLYRLIENEAAGEHVLELRAGGAGLKAYTFTFG